MMAALLAILSAGIVGFAAARFLYGSVAYSAETEGHAAAEFATDVVPQQAFRFLDLWRHGEHEILAVEFPEWTLFLNDVLWEAP